MGDALTGTVVRDTELTETQTLPTSGLADHTTYWENNASAFKVQLPSGINNQTPVIVQYGGHTLRFQPEGIADTSAVVAQPINETENAQLLQNKLALVTDMEERIKLQNEHATTVQKNRSVITYASVQNSLDLRYAIYGESLKEDLVFHALPTATSFSFAFTYTDLQAVLEADNRVIFYDNDGNAIFVVAAPFMTDATGAHTTAVTVTLESTETGCRYTLTPDRTWLEDGERAYPVMLDPTVSTTQNANYILDNGVQQASPNTNYMTTDRMYVGSGSNGNEARIYFKLSQWPSATGINSATITNATLNMSYYPVSGYQTGYNMNVDVYRLSSAWDTSTITWNSQTSIGCTRISTFYISDARGQTSGSDAIDVTSWVKTHYTNPSTDYGIRLQPRVVDSSKINWVCYISSDYYTNTTLRPIIQITYLAGSGSASGLIDGQTYYLRNVRSDLYLETSSAINAADLVQDTFTGGSEQQFQVVYDAEFYDYFLIPMCAPDMAMQITGTSSANGAVVQIWSKTTTNFIDSQRFSIRRNADGSYRLLSYASSYTKAVVVQDASETPLDNQERT